MVFITPAAAQPKPAAEPAAAKATPAAEGYFTAEERKFISRVVRMLDGHTRVKKPPKVGSLVIVDKQRRIHHFSKSDFDLIGKMKKVDKVVAASPELAEEVMRKLTVRSARLSQGLLNKAGEDIEEKGKVSAKLLAGVSLGLKEINADAALAVVLVKSVGRALGGDHPARLRTMISDTAQAEGLKRPLVPVKP